MEKLITELMEQFELLAPAGYVLRRERSCLADRIRAEILIKMNVRNAVGIAVFAIRNSIYSIEEK